MKRKIKFLRRNTKEYSRLGKKRKKLQKWRRPKGRDNKMRLKEKGRPRTVEIGYRGETKMRGKVDGKEVVIVRNMAELEKVGKEKLIIIAKIGAKKRTEIVKVAKEKGLKILNEEKKLKIKKKKVEEKKETKDKKEKKIEEKQEKKVEEEKKK